MDRRPYRAAFEVGSTVVMIALAATIVWQGRARVSGSRAPGTNPRHVAVPAQAISIGASAALGVESAPVALLEYADFECPYCARFAREIGPALRRRYVENGRVLLVFKHFPLPAHQNAQKAARAAWCAGRQERFWALHDLLFGRDNLALFDPAAAAGEVGLDLRTYEICLASREADQHVQAERADGERLKVSGAPVFFFGTIGTDRQVHVTDALLGAKSLEEFEVILDRLLRDH